jgi:preprotein translocase subunit SecG
MIIFLTIIHVSVCAMLMFVVLLQQGRGGGMGAAFGGATSQVFGNILTRATAVAAGIFMLTSVSLAWMSSTGDRAMKARIVAESQKKNERGTVRPKAIIAAPVTQNGKGSQLVPLGSRRGACAKVCAMTVRA